MAKKFWYTLAFCVWLAVIAWASLTPMEHHGGLSIKIPFLDKAAHFFFYFMATILGYAALKAWFAPKKIAIKSAWLVLMFIFSFGLLIEALQSCCTANRAAEFYDVTANLAGILLAILLIRLRYGKAMYLN